MMLPVDKLEPGMEIAADVLNLNGMLMLAKGTILTPRHLRTLKVWGVESIQVTGADDESPQNASLETSPELLQAAERRVSQRFKYVMVNTNTLSIIRTQAILRTVQLLSTQESEISPPATPP